ncbi:M48 family metallopeptidase [Desulfobacterota bacterium AH_259_B03_O07]|nr:M48 family metallopeptidase [Desulfobacterota bacterium AH_259_B03_O07]
MIDRKRKKSKPQKTSIILTVLFLSFCLLIACYQAPVTGRSQFILLSEDQEVQMGLIAYKEVLRKEKISKNAGYNQSVTRVGRRIAEVSDKPNYDWEFKVIKADDTINAFALPGGKVAVYTGILPIAKNEAGLATIMGHEIAHATARHGGERATTGILAELGAAGLSAAIGSQNPVVSSAIMQAYGVGVTVGGILPFSRAQEAEADRIGLVYMAEAGYDPKEALDFWKRMDQATRGSPKPPKFLSTHPGYGTRLSNIQKWLPEAMNYYERSKKAPNHPI